MSTRGSTVGVRRAIIALGVLVLTSATGVPQVSADQTFHTERIPLTSVAGAPLHSGLVVDIHANGPQIFALERYVLGGAAPNAAYQVNSLLFLTNTACTGAPIVSPDTRLQTDVAGNGEAGIVITPAQIPASVHNTVISIIWQVVNLGTGTVDYETGCVVVAVD
jgi:hypothetical protein